MQIGSGVGEAGLDVRRKSVAIAMQPAPGHAQRVDVESQQLCVALTIAFGGAPMRVKLAAVQLDDELRLRPPEVDEQATDQHVAVRTRKSVLGGEPLEAPLQSRVGAGNREWASSDAVSAAIPRRPGHGPALPREVRCLRGAEMAEDGAGPGGKQSGDPARPLGG